MTRFGRFGEILQNLAKDFKLLFSILQNLEPTLANLVCYLANIYCKWLHLGIWSHCIIPRQACQEQHVDNPLF